MDSSRRRFLQATPLAGTALSAPSASVPLRTEVRPWNNKPTLFLNGQPQYASFYALTDCPGGRWSWEEGPRLALQQFTALGFRLFQVDLFLESLWTKPGPLDLSLARRQLRGVLDVCTNAAIVIRWHLNAPPWWAAAHPAELCEYANGPREEITHNAPVRLIHDDLRRSVRVSLASQPWKEMATARTIEFLKGLAATPEGKALAGVHVCCGVYGEWHYWGFMHNEPDTGPAMQAAFASYRRQLGRPPLAVPNVEQRASLEPDGFRHPGRHEAVIDYYRCQQELVASLVLHFCQTVKQHWPRPLLAGAFYGYFFSMFSRQVTGGHLCLSRVLASPYIDYLSAPQAYGALYRDLGGCGITRGLVESIRHHGKLFLDEMDQSPSWKWQNNVDIAFVLTDLDADRAILRRNVLESYTRGMGFWYYDFGPANHTGWWNDQRLLAEIRGLKDLCERYHQRPYSPAGDVLFVYDTEVYYYSGSTIGADKITDAVAVNQATGAAWQSGVAMETIHLADLFAINLERFRVIVFANTFLLSPQQEEALAKRLAPSGAKLIFQRRHAPITDPAVWRELFRAAGAHIYVEGNRVVHAGGGLILVHGKDAFRGPFRLRSGRESNIEFPTRSSLIFDAQSGDRLL